jgi:hypothetical protein
MDTAFAIMSIACVDLRYTWAKTDSLEFALPAARHTATGRQITATFAFMDGELFAKRRAKPTARAGRRSPTSNASADPTPTANLGRPAAARGSLHGVQRPRTPRQRHPVLLVLAAGDDHVGFGDGIEQGHRARGPPAARIGKEQTIKASDGAIEGRAKRLDGALTPG